MRSIYLTNLELSNLITRVIRGEEYKYEAPHYKTLHPSDTLLQPDIPLSIRSPTLSGQPSFARRYNYKDYAVAQVVSLPSRSPGSAPKSVHVGLVVDKVAVGQIFPPISSIPCHYRSTVAAHTDISSRGTNKRPNVCCSSETSSSPTDMQSKARSEQSEMCDIPDASYRE
jgi:hypothetical protein